MFPVPGKEKREVAGVRWKKTKFSSLECQPFFLQTWTNLRKSNIYVSFPYKMIQLFKSLRFSVNKYPLKFYF